MEEENIMSQSVIGGIALALVGFFLLVFPHVVWKIAESWKWTGTAKASVAFLIVTRIVGGVLLVFGVLVAAGVLK